ncbi:MAG: hypothetical protein JRJ38_19565 [Deltaproteobacteria bacterium]|nr:hypothetical protein [Deltaproteobacteria bacterium]
MTAVLMPEYSPFFNAPGNDVAGRLLEPSTTSLPETCPPLPEMLAYKMHAIRGDGRRVPAHKLNAASGVGRRVASSGEAGGHLFVIFSACKPNSITN